MFTAIGSGNAGVKTCGNIDPLDESGAMPREKVFEQACSERLIDGVLVGVCNVCTEFNSPAVVTRRLRSRNAVMHARSGAARCLA
jgi:hypothetical protein